MFGELPKLIGYLVVAAVLGSAVYISNTPNPQTTPEPVAQTVEPKQWTPQVIFVTACDNIVGVIITTEPMLFATADRPITPEMEALARVAIAANLAYQFDGGSGLCGAAPMPIPNTWEAT